MEDLQLKERERMQTERIEVYRDRKTGNLIGMIGNHVFQLKPLDIDRVRAIWSDETPFDLYLLRRI